MLHQKRANWLEKYHVKSMIYTTRTALEFREGGRQPHIPRNQFFLKGSSVIYAVLVYNDAEAVRAVYKVTVKRVKKFNASPVKKVKYNRTKKQVSFKGRKGASGYIVKVATDARFSKNMYVHTKPKILI